MVTVTCQAAANTRTASHVTCHTADCCHLSACGQSTSTCVTFETPARDSRIMCNVYHVWHVCHLRGSSSR